MTLMIVDVYEEGYRAGGWESVSPTGYLVAQNDTFCRVLNPGREKIRDFDIADIEVARALAGALSTNPAIEKYLNKSLLSGKHDDADLFRAYMGAMKVINPQIWGEYLVELEELGLEEEDYDKFRQLYPSMLNFYLTDVEADLGMMIPGYVLSNHPTNMTEDDFGFWEDGELALP